MARQEPKKFKSKEEIKEYLLKISDSIGVERDELAERIGISRSAFYGYITRREIPYQSYLSLESLKVDSKSAEKNNNDVATNLSRISLDDLISEIEGRGWLIELKRKL